MPLRSHHISFLTDKAQPAAALLFVLFTLVAYGFEHLDSALVLAITHVVGAVLAGFQGLMLLVAHRRMGTTFWAAQRSNLPELVWFCLLMAFLPFPGLFAMATTVSQVVVLARWFSRTALWAALFPFLMSHAAKTLAGSFLLLISVGTLLLMLPVATKDPGGASFVDALFTSASAVCVTGLAVLNTATDSAMNVALGTFSRFGQSIILLLIQLGGLSMMTLSAALVMAAGRHLDLRSRAALGDILDERDGRPLESAVGFILGLTLTVEVVAAVLLFSRFALVAPTLSEAAFWSVFHSVSAFCNAGFSLFGDSLVRFSSDYVVILTIASSIVIGGLGYATVACALFSLVMRKRSQQWRHWTYHAKLAGTITAVLLIFGFIFTFYAEYYNSLSGMGLGDKLMAALFHSVTLRTAGFNTIDVGSLSRLSVVLAIAMMFVGASPGGTGGGLKTTTVGVLILGIRATLQGRDRVEVWKRHIEFDIVLKAVSIVAISIATIVIAWGLLLVLEPEFDAITLLFESVSAFATVGLSLGITPELSSTSKLILIVLMYVGRIGPLGLAFALHSRRRPAALSYPSAKIGVG